MEIVYGMLLVNAVLLGSCGIVALRDWILNHKKDRQIESELNMIELERRARR